MIVSKDDYQSWQETLKIMIMTLKDDVLEY
jgi:hypothetical protein